jgi:hypothetical protein
MAQSDLKKEEQEWPCVTEHDSGTLIISRVRNSDYISPVVACHISALKIPPPAYDDAICDGFRTSFISRSAGEIYECFIKDADVAKLCYGGLSIDAEAFTKLIQGKSEKTAAEQNKIIVRWLIYLAPGLACTVRLDLDRVADTEGRTSVFLELRLRLQTRMITELKLRIAALEDILIQEAKASADKIAELETQIADDFKNISARLEKLETGTPHMPIQRPPAAKLVASTSAAKVTVVKGTKLDYDRMLKDV